MQKEGITEVLRLYVDLKQQKSAALISSAGIVKRPIRFSKPISLVCSRKN